MFDLTGYCVLVVDDEPVLRELLAEELGLYGATSFTAQDGLEAFAIYEKCHDQIHWVISDIRMPNSTGAQLAEKIRKSGLTQPKIVLVTGYSHLETNSPAQLKVDAMFKKPYKLPEILNFLLK